MLERSRKPILVPLCWVAVVGCAAAEQAASDSPPSQTASSPPLSTNAPSAAPSSSALEPAAQRPPAAAGRERLTFALTGGEGLRIPVTFDVPPSWGINPFLFQSCEDSLSLFGASIRLQAERCQPKESPEACVERSMMQLAEFYKASYADPDKPAIPRVITSRRDTVEVMPPEEEVVRYQYDKAHHAVVYCRWRAIGETRLARAMYKDICSSLTLLPATTNAPDLELRLAKPPGNGNATDVPWGDELVKAVVDFQTAVSTGDMAAAKKLIATPSVCDTIAADDKRAKCKSELSNRTHFENKMKKLHKVSSKQTFRGAQLSVMRRYGKGAAAVYSAIPLAVQETCGPTALDWDVAWVDGRGAVILPIADEAWTKGIKLK